jgi:hypothetical protein
VLAASLGIARHFLLQNPSVSQIPMAATSSKSKVQPVAPRPAAQPAPPSTETTPTSEYFKTQWGSICEVTAQKVTCQACIPGEALPARQTCADPAPGRAVNTAGTHFETNAVTIDASSDMQRISNGGSYLANGWTVAGIDGWARFTNDETGHGMAYAPMNYDLF